ncbi:MAG TPA: hypothetical protein VHD32_08795 [Candidatus Didemnitutus sp.]|nr:hypothetical protein [Candidatus Didemnitutus sp.]
MTELEQVTELCRRLGANDTQAATMAAQLIKRADQLVVERGITRVQAMQHLLQVLVEGRAGRVPGETGQSHQ